MAKHIANRFEFETLVAGFFRMISNPSIYKKYQKHLDPKWVYQNDESEGPSALREVVKLTKKLHEEGKTDDFSISYVRQNVPLKFIDAEKGENLSKIIHGWCNDEEITKRINDDGVFNTFLDYLKVIHIASVSKEFFDCYQTGEITKAMDLMSGAINMAQGLDDSDSHSLTKEEIIKTLNGQDQLVHKVLYPFNNPMDDVVGGFEPQTLNLFLSVTNGGKTTFSHHIIESCIRQKMHVFVACVEDREKSFIYKFIANMTGIPIKRLKKRYQELSSTDVAKVEEALELFEEYVHVEFVYGRAVDVVHKLALDHDIDCDLNNKPKPVVNIVDYTGHIASKAGGDKMHEKMRNAYAARKDFALANNKICIDFAQVNREGSKNMNSEHPLTQADLAGSYDLAQVCDNIVSINRSAQDISTDSAKFHVCKARDGMVGVTIRVATDFSCANYLMDEWSWTGSQPASLTKEYGEGSGNDQDSQSAS